MLQIPDLAPRACLAPRVSLLTYLLPAPPMTYSMVGDPTRLAGCSERCGIALLEILELRQRHHGMLLDLNHAWLAGSNKPRVAHVLVVNAQHLE